MGRGRFALGSQRTLETRSKKDELPGSRKTCETRDQGRARGSYLYGSLAEGRSQLHQLNSL